MSEQGAEAAPAARVSQVLLTRVAPPLAVGLLVLAAWQIAVDVKGIPPYILPGPWLIAPTIIIWVKDINLALLICAWIVAFFPIVSNTTLGLNSTDHNLLALLQLYGASRRQVFWNVRQPSALPYFLGGLRISGGLALIGAVVAEFVAGSGGIESGLAYRL